MSTSKQHSHQIGTHIIRMGDRYLHAVTTTDEEKVSAEWWSSKLAAATFSEHEAHHFAGKVGGKVVRLRTKPVAFNPKEANSPEWFAQKLVDWVATVTQLDPAPGSEGGLPNVEDWRSNAEKLFAQAIAAGKDEMKAAALKACNHVATGLGDRNQPPIARVYKRISEI